MKLKRVICALLCALTFTAVLPAATGQDVAQARAFDPVNYANADPDKYYVEVDLTNNIVTVYEKGETGKYDTVAMQALCTPGAKATPTPTGTFTLNTGRRRFGYFTKYDCYAQYWVQVAGGIYFHSILYSRPVEGYFTRTSFNAIGSVASHGCIRMYVEDVRWLFYNCPPGTQGIIRDDLPAKPELAKSLKKTISASQYKPEPDQYENTPRPEPSAILRTGSAVVNSSGKTVARAAAGDKVTVVLSGRTQTKVRTADGKEGYIKNALLDFQPNGPIEGAKVVNVISKANAKVYDKPTNTIDPSTTLEKGTEVTILSSTVYYHEITAGDVTGYVNKRDISTETIYPDDGESPDEEPGEPEDEETKLTVYRVKSESAFLYEKASNEQPPIARFGEGTDLEYLGYTVYYYKVKVGGRTGFIRKADVGRYTLTLAPDDVYEPQLVELPLEEEEEEAPEEELAPEEEAPGDEPVEIGPEDQSGDELIPSVVG